MRREVLKNVIYIRLFLVVLLVLYHSFAIFSGAWETIIGVPEIRQYWWLANICYACLLESFVFISGYLFGYQVRYSGEGVNVKKVVTSKAKRLILPSIVFSFIYILLFLNIKQPLWKTCYDLLSGVGHLWFLPMLFWCFIALILLDKTKIKPRIILFGLIIISLCSFIPLPFQLSRCMFYMPFFYAGYYLQLHNINLRRYYNIRYLLASLLSFIVIFPILLLSRSHVLAQLEVIDIIVLRKVLYSLYMNFSQLIISFIGLSFLFVLAGILENKCAPSFTVFWVGISNLCMGVYLFQQFILKFLYYKTPYATMINPYVLPWLAFGLTLIISISLSFWLRKTNFGRFLIG